MSWCRCLLCGEPTRWCVSATALCEPCATDFAVCAGCGDWWQVDSEIRCPLDPCPECGSPVAVPEAA